MDGWDQSVKVLHGLCAEERHEPDHSTWWFYPGILCTHPEWHEEAE